jgi:hypothetical protein
MRFDLRLVEIEDQGRMEAYDDARSDQEGRAISLPSRGVPEGIIAVLGRLLRV